MLWLIFAFMTAMVLVALLLPLLQKKKAISSLADYDLMIYRDQLSEIERDGAYDLIMPELAQAARVEIQRRMLTAKDSKVSSALDISLRSQSALLAGIIFGLPLLALLAYGFLGSPNIEGKPYVGRVRDPDFVMAMDAQKLALLLAKKPDIQGYQYLADIYFLLRRYAEAAASYQKIIDMGRSNAKTWSSLGEMTTLSHDDIVVPEAKSAFLKAYRLDSHDERSRFYLGVWEMENNEPGKAVAIWRDLEKDSSANAEWLKTLKEHIAIVSKKAGLSPESVTPQPPSQFFK